MISPATVSHSAPNSPTLRQWASAARRDGQTLAKPLATQAYARLALASLAAHRPQIEQNQGGGLGVSGSIGGGLVPSVRYRRQVHGAVNSVKAVSACDSVRAVNWASVELAVNLAWCGARRSIRAGRSGRQLRLGSGIEEPRSAGSPRGFGGFNGGPGSSARCRADAPAGVSGQTRRKCVGVRLYHETTPRRIISSRSSLDRRRSRNLVNVPVSQYFAAAVDNSSHRRSCFSFFTFAA